MSDGPDRQDLIIDINAAPDDWAKWIEASGIETERVEAQPIADQVKLHKCINVPAILPRWMRRGEIYLA